MPPSSVCPTHRLLPGPPRPRAAGCAAPCKPLRSMPMPAELSHQLPGLSRQLPTSSPRRDHSDRHPVTVEFMIFVISALTGAEVREIMNELNRRYPLHHLEPQLVFAAQPQRCAVQHADGRSIHFISEDREFVAHVGYSVHVIVTPDLATI